MDDSGSSPRSTSSHPRLRTLSATAVALLIAAAPAIAAPSGAGTDPQERVLDVTLVPAAAAPRHQAGAPAGSKAIARTGGTGLGLLAWVAAAGAAAIAGRWAWRRRAPRCPSCRAAMRRLGGEGAFAELDMAERTEHLVGDVRYTVWRCQGCGTVEKRGTARDVQGLAAQAVAPPVGSAAFLRRRAQTGLSIWIPTPTTTKPGQPAVASTPSISSTRRSRRSGP
jgi:hypothetical protein